MQLNWSTFLLEVLNFLILVWLLKRFLYKPVLAAIARRKAAIDKSLADAQARHEEAQALELEYQNRLAAWEQEKESLRAALMEELRAQRERLTEDLRKSLEQEREKERVLNERRLAELEKQAAEQGTTKGVQFTARLLERIAGPELEARLVAVMVEELLRVPSMQRDALQAACHDRHRAVSIASAFPLLETERAKVIEALRTTTGEDIAAEFEQDSSLVAGLRIGVGPWIMRANLRDELRFFAEMVNHDGGQSERGS